LKLKEGNITMTVYEQLLAAERSGAHTVEVVSRTGLSGVAKTAPIMARSSALSARMTVPTTGK
jgi:hypothetical protein